MAERALPSWVRPEAGLGGSAFPALGAEACPADSLFINLSRLAAYSTGEGIVFFRLKHYTAKRKIMVSDGGCGIGNVLHRAAGVEMKRGKIYFQKV